MNVATAEGLALETFADLRRRFGPHQRAFAEFVGITQTQVSLFERGKTAPRGETLERIAAACDIDVQELLQIVERTKQRAVDPYFANTDVLVRIAADMLPPHARPRPLIIATGAIAFGTACVRHSLAGDELDWFAVGSTANAALHHLGTEAWEADPLLASARAGLRGIRELCREIDHSLRADLEVQDWEELVTTLVAQLDSDQEHFDRAYDSAMGALALVATGSPDAFVASAPVFLRHIDEGLHGAPAIPQSRLTHVDILAAFVEGFLEGLRTPPPTAGEIEASYQELEAGLSGEPSSA